MDETRRNFILGMTSAYAAITISGVSGTSLLTKNSNAKNNQITTQIPKYESSSYDIYSPAIIGSAISAFALNNIEYIYSIMLILITIFLLLTIGIPGYEYLLDYSALFHMSN